MFNRTITRFDPFTSSLINKVFEARPLYAIDDTIKMTSIVLLYKRVENLKVSSQRLNPVLFPAEGIELSTDPNTYSLYWFEKQDPTTILKPFEKKFQKIESLPPQEKYYTKTFDQQIYFRVMPEENTVCIFAEEITTQLWHAVQFLFPKFFKVFKEKPLSKEETDFLLTLTQKRPDDYLQKIRELVNTEEFQSYALKDQLFALERKLFDRKVSAAKDRLNQLEQAMEQAMQQYRNACSQRFEAVALVSGLEAMRNQKEEKTELQEYLTNNKRISHIIIDGNDISFIAKTELVPYLTDDWEIISKSENYFYKFEEESSLPLEDVKLLLNAIFSEDAMLKLKMCAYFQMDYFGSGVRTASHYDFAGIDKTLQDYIPNPHLNLHNCFGQNATAILDQLKCGDVIGAIECCIACAQRVNIHEGISFNPFVHDLLNSKGKCLVADGRDMTIEEAINYLKEKNNE